jgi:hypothetical protein
MIRPAICAFLTAGLLMASGCAERKALLCDPCGKSADAWNCGGRPIDSQEACQPPQRGADCSSCNDTACDRPCGPLTWFFDLFHPETYEGCGCSEERYYGDWASYPPPCQEPCDQCGNYVGKGAPQAGGGPTGYVNQRGGTADRVVMSGTAAAPQGPCAKCGGRHTAHAAPNSQRTVSSSTTAPADSTPRVLSVTDEVVKPAQPETQRTAQPRRTTTQR